LSLSEIKSGGTDDANLRGADWPRCGQRPEQHATPVHPCSANFPGGAGWHLIGLNAYVRGPGAAKAQIDWLKKDLEANKQGCLLGFWHAFLFSSGNHGHGDSDDENAMPKRESLMGIAFGTLYDAGASVVLGGHDHDYEQFKPHDAKGNAVADGIRSFVVGTGGAPLYNDVQYNKRAVCTEN
jgi:hypothetical protein